jgi:hypothetical protein
LFFDSRFCFSNLFCNFFFVNALIL